MRPHLSVATLAAQDPPALAKYYERLGWKAAFQNGEVAFFQLGGVVLALWRRADFAKAVGKAAAAIVPGATALAQNVPAREDVDRALAEAQAAGGTIVQPAEDTDWGGRSGHFADPEGFLWEVAWNPAWTLREDGSVHIPVER